ncbi:MAG TPA: S8 family peptidase [Solirubrobacteraceae bacterium]|nr:S8 family peptidase [Solirubrobacteraceae bacterium]
MAADDDPDRPPDSALVLPADWEPPEDDDDTYRPPPEEVDLLLKPHAKTTASRLAKVLDHRLELPREQTRLAVNEAYVACRLDFGRLLTLVLPLTEFWQDHLWPKATGTLAEKLDPDRVARFFEEGQVRQQGRSAIKKGDIPGNVIWLIGVAGRVRWEHVHGAAAAAEGRERPTAREVVDAGFEVLGGVPLGRPEDLDQAYLWSVSCNRPVHSSVWRSRVACKADAATRVFGLSCREIRWAVIDSGIDARHPAFARRSGDEPIERTGAPEESAASRVVKTYDFARIRAVLSGTEEPKPDAALEIEDPEDDVAQQTEDWVTLGRSVDWELIKTKLEIVHDGDYREPQDDHGTHVAGIIAADWRPGDTPHPGEHHVQGMCPDIDLYDLRAFGEDGSSDEFSILSAMQFVRHLNANADLQLVHGANLSFSVRHEVAKYAAGRTPVCEEAHRLVHSGVVVVAAAGNDGRAGYVVKGRSIEGYRTVAISDPGNAEAVITVGATHRDRPHTYGVSYFSSRGPTGDGRAKPDLVAPGEKITSPIPDAGLQSKDGTSQAAPHVSGASALLLARHPELIGQPERVKQVLMESCTDLGHERSFQGAGMVDVLRAIQAV